MSLLVHKLLNAIVKLIQNFTLRNIVLISILPYVTVGDIPDFDLALIYVFTD